MTKRYLFEVWNIAGMAAGTKFIIKCTDAEDPYYDVLLPALHSANVECWHIDYVAREVGQYNGSWEAVQAQRDEEEVVAVFSPAMLTPGARYRNE